MSDKPSEVPEFATVLLQHNNGITHDQATKKLSELVQAVKKEGKKGTISISVTVLPVKKDNTMVYLQTSVAAKIPQEEPAAKLFFTDENGGLHKNQPGLFGNVSADTLPAQDGKSAAAGRD
ncbi:hypothetical protein A5717_26180 [Mycolicibacterium porcinum]|uniref:hypothetical protein n=1 Tax=Mycolicibacterium porcinum TaxID=39693 RepID=UPI00080BA73C|nr:hypothetical protein [Mycolicibacterium porcinum]OCB09266.1 hypothetical protein A5717_26180 [Mycolicibacterium porcinum]